MVQNLSGGQGVASSNLAAPTILFLDSICHLGKRRWDEPPVSVGGRLGGWRGGPSRGDFAWDE